MAGLFEPHPVIKRAGLQDDPVFGQLQSLRGLSEGTRQWIRERYRRTCAGCGLREYTSPRGLPVCGACWRSVPLETAVWWWKGERTQRRLLKLLDACFDGGYEVAPDERQVIV